MLLSLFLYPGSNAVLFQAHQDGEFHLTLAISDIVLFSDITLIL